MHSDIAALPDPHVAALPAQADGDSEAEDVDAAGVSDAEDLPDVDAPEDLLRAPANLPGGSPLGIHVGDLQAQLQHEDLDADAELDAYGARCA